MILLTNLIVALLLDKTICHQKQLCYNWNNKVAPTKHLTQYFLKYWIIKPNSDNTNAIYFMLYRVLTVEVVEQLYHEIKPDASLDMLEMAQLEMNEG